MVAYTSLGRTRLVGSNRLGALQYFRSARCVSHDFRGHLRPRAENSRSYPKSLWPESRRAVRAFSAGGRWDQDVDQGRCRPGARGQGRAFFRAHTGRGHRDSRARRHSLRPKHDAVWYRWRHLVFLRRRISHRACRLHGRLGQQQQVFDAGRNARDRANGQL